MKRLIVILIMGLVAAACAPSTDDSAVSTAGDDPPTTTAPAATTTAPDAPTTTTQGIDAAVVAPTPVVGPLEPYSDNAEDLFPTGSVEAHWYQWNGLYVVLYRGYDALSGQEICAGNSIFPPGQIWIYITNSPHIGVADEICIDTAKIAEAPSGVRACGSLLLYYVTEIPTDVEGDLYGTLEIGSGGGNWNGHTGFTPSDLANTPEFEPGLAAYELPPSDFDALGVVDCNT
jgi:hypothetical protein